jgi:hypothetical protein
LYAARPEPFKEIRDPSAMADAVRSTIDSLDTHPQGFSAGGNGVPGDQGNPGTERI